MREGRESLYGGKTQKVYSSTNFDNVSPPSLAQFWVASGFQAEKYHSVQLPKGEGRGRCLVTVRASFNAATTSWDLLSSSALPAGVPRPPHSDARTLRSLAKALGTESPRDALSCPDARCWHSESAQGPALWARLSHRT